MQKQKNKNKFDRFIVELFGWGFISLTLAGIWTPHLRGRLLATASFCLFLTLIFTNSIIQKEKGDCYSN